MCAYTSISLEQEAQVTARYAVAADADLTKLGSGLRRMIFCDDFPP